MEKNLYEITKIFKITLTDKSTNEVIDEWDYSKNPITINSKERIETNDK